MCIRDSYYIGPIDGHDVTNLVTILENVKNSKYDGPILIHAITKKGKGYKPAEESGDKYHGVSKFNVATGEQSKAKSKVPSYTKVFANTLIKHAENDTKIVDGIGSEVLGSPFNVLEWSINHLSKYKKTINKGDIITTGTCTGITPVLPGDNIIADFYELGKIKLNIVK